MITIFGHLHRPIHAIFVTLSKSTRQNKR